jgi:hypothetical protein
LLTIAGEGRDGGGGLSGRMGTGIAQIELSGRRDSALAFRELFLAGILDYKCCIRQLPSSFKQLLHLHALTVPAYVLHRRMVRDSASMVRINTLFPSLTLIRMMTT